MADGPVSGHPVGTGTVLLDQPEEGLAIATLARPHRLNAIDDDLVDDLHRALDRLDGERAVRAIVLTGAGRAFCAGADLRAPAGGTQGSLRDRPSDEVHHRQRRWSALGIRLHELAAPVVAAVNGPAVGGGFALAVACDVRVAAESAHFSVANVRLGLSGGEMGLTWLLPRAVGTARATELLLTGRRIDADEALAWGLVSRVVPVGGAVGAALEIARMIAANPAFGVSLTKQLLQVTPQAATLREASLLEDRTQTVAVYAGDVDRASRAFRAREK
jgi:enoyl-CoA hydratase